MTFELPTRNILVHKPVEPRNLSKKLQAELDLHTKDWGWQLKFDGCHMIVVVQDGKASAWSREGNPVLSVPHILEAVERFSPPNYVYFGEAYNYRMTFAKISGMFRRQSPQPLLEYVIFDAVPLADFIQGECPVDYWTRYEELDQLYVKEYGNIGGPLYIAKLVRGNELPKLYEHEENQRKAGFHLGLDGYVAKRLDGWWVAGAGKGGETIKVKDHVSVDLRVLRLVEGQGKFAGMLGSLVCDYKGQELLVSGGTMSNLDRETVWHEPQILVGKIVEVHGLMASEHGLLREPRFHRTRFEKTEPSV